MTKEHETINISGDSSKMLCGDIPSTSSKTPCGDLLAEEESGEDILNVRAQLYDASINADWQAANAILKKRPQLVRYAISESDETPLHVAVSQKDSSQRTMFVQKLVQIMESKDLELKDDDGNTTLCSAAIAGNVQSAKLIVIKNTSLLDIPDNYDLMPLYLAAIYGKRDMVRFLYNMSSRKIDGVWTPFKWADILVGCIKYDMFDVALNIKTDIKGLSAIFNGVEQSNGDKTNLFKCRSLLSALARKTEVFKKRKETKVVNQILSLRNPKQKPVDTYGNAMKILRYVWENICIMMKNEIEEILSTREHLYDTLFVAAELGNTAFVVELLRGYRDLILKTNEDNRTIIHIAVLHGHEGIYNLIHEIGVSKKKIILSLQDKNGNNILHLFGLRSRDKMTRRPIQIVREFHWYKEVEMMLPDNREKKNNSGKTPYELFSKNSQEALNESMKWADYGLVVATLVLGSSFAATCSVPGGFDQNKGYPVLTNEPSFSVFALADTVAFLASVVSVLSFLSIVIFGRRDKEHMFDSLATTMLLGITTLLLSIMAMMVALSASLIIVYHNSLRWMIAPTFATFFIILVTFLFDQFPLYKDMVLATYHKRHDF